MNIRCFQIPIAALILLGSVRAQSPVNSYSMVHSEPLRAGIRKGILRYAGRGDARDVVYTDVDLAVPGSSVEFVDSLDGPLAEVSLKSLTDSVGGLASLGFDTPSADSTAGLPAGLRIGGGRLYSWPAGGAPHIVLRPEGSVSLAWPETLPGTVTLDDGTSLTLVSINGALPEKTGEAAVYTGRLRGGELPVAVWPEDIRIVPLFPSASDADPHGLFIAGTQEDRRFRPSLPIETPGVYTNAGDSLLLLKTSPGSDVEEKLDRGMALTITVSLAPTEALAAAVFPVVRVIRDPEGRGTDAAGKITNGIAFDRTGRRLLLFSAPGNRATDPGIEASRLKDFADGAHLETIVDTGGAISLLLPDARARIAIAGAASAPVRFALVARERPATLELPGVAGELARVRGVLIEGTRLEFPGNYGRMLVDGVTGFTPELDGFWASEFVRRNPSAAADATVNSMRIVPPRPVAVAAVELIHAEGAGFSPEFDLRHFRILGRANRNDSWRLLADVDHKVPVSRERIVIDGAPRLAELRLEIVEPSFLPGGNVARLVELFLWSPLEE